MYDSSATAVADLAWDAGLDDQQLAAVIHGNEPLVVLAGAGTGKTRTLTSRVAALLESGVATGADPAADLHPAGGRGHARPRRGDCAATGGRQPASWGGTFHAVAHRLIAEHAERSGLAPTCRCSTRATSPT